MTDLSNPDQFLYHAKQTLDLELMRDDYEKFTLTTTNELVGRIIDVDVFKGNFGPSVRLTVDRGSGDIVTTVFGKTQVDKQLNRMGLNDPSEMVGNSYKFDKTPMKDDPTKGFLNIKRVGGGQPSAVPYPAADSQVSRDLRSIGVLPNDRPTLTYDEIKQKYIECFTDAAAVSSEVMAESDGKYEPLVENVAHSLLLARVTAGV